MPVIVIAGTDSSGGAGLAADLEILSRLKVPRRLAVSGSTAQDDGGLRSLETVRPAHLRAQLAAAAAGWPAAPVKVGMLPSPALIKEVATFLVGHRGLRVADPVAGPSAGGSWGGTAWRAAYVRYMPAGCDLVTPNLAEARLLAGLDRGSPERCAGVLRQQGFARVLITGARTRAGCGCDDLFAEAVGLSWLEGVPAVGSNTRGTGCTLSSAIAGSVARGSLLADALIVAKMHVTAKIAGVTKLDPNVRWRRGCQPAPQFPPMTAPLGVCPIAARVERLADCAAAGVSALQLRIKDLALGQVATLIAAAGAGARRHRLRLFVNDYWQEAVRQAKSGVHGIHLGQEDVASADLETIAKAGLRLGLSAHSWSELAVARALNPSYVSLGPVFATSSKRISFAPLGLAQLRRMTCARSAPTTVAIGGITAANVAAVAKIHLSGVASMAGTNTTERTKALVAAWRCGIAQRTQVQR